jgi:hypothetical protein
VPIPVRVARGGLLAGRFRASAGAGPRLGEHSPPGCLVRRPRRLTWMLKVAEGVFFLIDSHLSWFTDPFAAHITRARDPFLTAQSCLETNKSRVKNRAADMPTSHAVHPCSSIACDSFCNTKRRQAISFINLLHMPSGTSARLGSGCDTP